MGKLGQVNNLFIWDGLTVQKQFTKGQGMVGVDSDVLFLKFPVVY